MRAIVPGHRYALKQLDGISEETLQFVQRQPHHTPHPGTINQEVIRALIDRIKLLETERHWADNAMMITYLRTCITIHEERAFYYHAVKGGLDITQRQAKERVSLWRLTMHSDKVVEDIPTGNDGHWEIPL